MNPGFAYVWTYLVRPGREGMFTRIYGPDGDWVRLFRQADGYLRSELHLDRHRPRRFLSVDYWRSEEDYRDFRRRFAAEFESLDDRCGEMTEEEVHVGDFEPVDG